MSISVRYFRKITMPTLKIEGGIFQTKSLYYRLVRKRSHQNPKVSII
jgi:hypothetical protein